jgi:hypothetical protein
LISGPTAASTACLSSHIDRAGKKYARELVVIGVHSAKFQNEGDVANIRQAILRYEI